MPLFNLVDEGWIPCLGPDGVIRELGLKEALTRAHEMAEISDPSPLVTVSLHRLLLAILHRVFGPEDLDAWKHHWRRRLFDGAVLAGYFSAWRHRFDLFHSERPFYQVPRMKGDTKDPEEHPVHALALEAAAGNNKTLFDHSWCDKKRKDSAPPPFSPAEAARCLVARQAYSVGFGKSSPIYFQDSPLIRGFTVLALGDSLFETLMLNLIAYKEYGSIGSNGQDLPAWEQESAREPDVEGTRPLGYLDYLTWQSRRIHLVEEGDPPVVRWCQVQQNLALPNLQPTDPFKCYRRDEKRGWLPLGLNVSRVLWRDSHTLFEPAGVTLQRPEVFNWIAEVRRSASGGGPSLRPVCRFLAIGVATEDKAANVVLWREERLPLPLAYLEEKDLRDTLLSAVRAAEEGAECLRRSARRMALRTLKPGLHLGREWKSVERKLRERAESLAGSWAVERTYWPTLEAPFRRLLADLPRDLDTDGDYGLKILPAWLENVRRAAGETFAVTVSALEPVARTLRAVAEEEGCFHRELAKKLKEFSPAEQGGEP